MKTKVMILSGIFTMVFLFVVGFSPANAAIPYTVNYQGYLTNAVGSPVNGTVSMTFSLYTAASGGTALWTETQNVSVSGGIYGVVLGSVSALTPVAFDVPYWLGVRVGSDAEMVPRVQLTSVGYAFTSDLAMDLVCPGCVNFSDIAQNGCSANQFMMWSGTAWTCSAPTVAETDPQVGTLTANLWCRSNAGGTAIDCATAAPITVETDPQVGATTLNQWCIGSGTTVECSQSAAALAAAHNHDAAYVNVIGDAMTGALTVGITGAGSALTVTNSGTGPGLTVTGGGDGSYADLFGDLFLGGNIGEIFAISAPDSDLALYSNGDVFIDLDNNNDAANAQFAIYNGTDNSVFTVDENGDVNADGTVAGNAVKVVGGPAASKPTCVDATNRGMLWFTQGITGGGATTDTLEVCAKDAADTYAWRTLW